ncbi:MAG: DEAD/DEAH box helicase [Pyrinomonadaceae bacterium]|nr:DEAD/DEAH box helicase [Pyrinomonadaceae bacterium]
MSFNLLAEPIRRFIREQRWETLRPIQNAAISKILKTEDNYILSARTASGKTEAAFLPVLSKVDFNEPGVRVLYISPLKALINDQFRRVEDLCTHLDVTVTKWHGDANRTAKKRLVKKPNGIVLITPESIEAMFVNRPYEVKSLFSNLEFVVIDEIHSFVGTDRGTQLKSLLSRIQSICLDQFRVIGLSATIGEHYEETKRFTGSWENTKILVDSQKKAIDASFRYFERDVPELPVDLLKDLYLETKDCKTLVFPNDRGTVEEVAVRLKKLSQMIGGHPYYFSHHSSVDKEVREYVEFFAKKSERENFLIACTSTLELGIDIGSLDKTIQIDSTHSVASLVQRIGRSGRSESKSSNLVLYATNPWTLLQSIACYELQKEGFIEPPQVIDKPYDILLHQTLSIAKSRSGIHRSELVQELKMNTAFNSIEITEIEEIIEHLIEIDFLEKLGLELIIGIEGEQVVNSRNFYTVFETTAEYAVVNFGNTIGSIPLAPQFVEDENIFLAARIWKITSVDHDAMQIEVVAANDGKPPRFSGGFGRIHPRIREKMFEIVLGADDFDYLNQSGTVALTELRRFFANFRIEDKRSERPLQVGPKNSTLYTFTGTRINTTLSFLLDVAGISHLKCGLESSLEFDGLPKAELLSKWESVSTPLANLDQHLRAMGKQRPQALNSSKWSQFLPVDFKVMLLKQRNYDIAGTSEFFKNTQFIANRCT